MRDDCQDALLIDHTFHFDKSSGIGFVAEMTCPDRALSSVLSRK
jgi:hypothetical protein